MLLTRTLSFLPLQKMVAILCLVTLLAPLPAGALVQQPAPQSGTQAAQPAPPAEPAAAKPVSETVPATPAPAAAAPATVTPTKVTLKEGTEVNLVFAQLVSSKTAVVGDPVEMVLDQDLVVNQNVVVKKGAKALATVTAAKKSGMMGRGGELSVHLEYLLAGDSKVRLRGVQGRAGDDKTGATVGLVIAFGVLGFMKHGKQAEVKQDTPIKAYVDQDIELPVLAQTAPAKTN